jgi:hypothetical protein
MGDLVGSEPNHILLAACADAETSQAGNPDSPWPAHGGVASLFTYYLADELMKGSADKTFDNSMRIVQRRIANFVQDHRIKDTQTPQCEGLAKDAPIASLLSK